MSFLLAIWTVFVRLIAVDLGEVIISMYSHLNSHLNYFWAVEHAATKINIQTIQMNKSLSLLKLTVVVTTLINLRPTPKLYFHLLFIYILNPQYEHKTSPKRLMK